jgi:Fe2+ transport system protein B
MAEEPNSEQVLHRLFDQVSEHLETRWKYFTLSSTEKLSSVVANMAGAITVFVFAILVLFFFSMGFAWWLGDFIGNRAGGFALAGLIFIPISWLVFRWIRPFIREKIIETVLQHEDAAKNDTHE